MSFLINDLCTNCGACEPECPNSAVYESEYHWKYSEGTGLQGIEKKLNGDIINADEENQPLSNEIYFIVEDKCTDCLDYSEKPQCAAVCPMDAIHISVEESEEQLRQKMNWLHKSETPYDSCPVPLSHHTKPSCCHSQVIEEDNPSILHKSNDKNVFN